MNRPVNLFWSESSHYFGANSPVRNFERNVPEESSREELVLERTVPEPAYRMGLEPGSVRLLTLSNIEISKTSWPIAIKIYMKPSIIGVMERLH